MFNVYLLCVGGWVGIWGRGEGGGGMSGGDLRPPSHVMCKVNGGIMKHLRFLTSLSWTVDRGVQYPCGKTTAIINLSKSQVLVEVLHFP